AGLDIIQDGGDGVVGELCTLGEVAALIEAALAEEQANTFRAELVELVDCTKHGQSATGILIAAEADRLKDAVQNLTVVDADDIIAACDAKRFQYVGHHHAHFRIGGDVGRADRVGVELHELAE